ncbi:MAG: hypothetical protein IJG24_00075 [Selenomonadaceae bacterium]|nr:hypothetical protein [Selenomonadaceae bacterium]
MAFCDDIKADLDIFVETDEFAAVVNIDGVECKAQWLSHTADKSNRQSETFTGLYGEFSELYFKTEPYLEQHKKLPHRGDTVVVNGERYEVTKAEDELGILHLILSSYRSNRPRFGDRRVD